MAVPAVTARITRPEDYSPPKGIRTFGIRFYGYQRGLRAGATTLHQSTVDHLSDEELAFVVRVVAAELCRREAR